MEKNKESKMYILTYKWEKQTSPKFNLMFDNKIFSLESTMDGLKIRFEEAKASVVKNCPVGSVSISSSLLTHKPPPHYIKINTDAAIKNGVSMIGIVARDHQGEVLKVKAMPLHSNNPELAEAFGVLQNLISAKEEGWSRIWCESDARNIILNLNNLNLQTMHRLVEGIIKDILQLKSNFQEVFFI